MRSGLSTLVPNQSNKLVSRHHITYLVIMSQTHARAFYSKLNDQYMTHVMPKKIS